MRQIFVDSRDRSSGTSTDFTMALPQTLSLNSGHTGRIDDLRLPNAIPTISVANNGIEIWTAGQYWFRTMVNGQCFDGGQLASKIWEAIKNVHASQWTVVYKADEMTLEITFEHDFVFTEGGTFSKQLLSRPYTRNNLKHYLFLYTPLQGLDMCYLCCPHFSHMDKWGPRARAMYSARFL